MLPKRAVFHVSSLVSYHSCIVVLQFLFFLLGKSLRSLVSLLQNMLSSSRWSITNVLLPAESRETLVEYPFDCFFNRLIEQEWQSWDSCQSQPNGAVRAYSDILDIFHGSPGILDDRVDCKSRKSHRCNSLKKCSLDHHGSVII
jgi:hypothetical protein